MIVYYFLMVCMFVGGLSSAVVLTLMIARRVTLAKLLPQQKEPLPIPTPETQVEKLIRIGKELTDKVDRLRRYRAALDTLRYPKVHYAVNWTDLELEDHPDDPLRQLQGGNLLQRKDPEFRVARTLQIQAHERRERQLLTEVSGLQEQHDILSSELGLERVDFSGERPLDRVRIVLPRDELDDVQKQIATLREREEALIKKLLEEEQANAQGPHRKAAGVASRDGN